MLSIFGAICSFVGALIAGHQAWRSKKNADRAEEIKSEIVIRRFNVELSSLQEKTRTIIQKISHYGPSATEESLKGVDVQSDAKVIQDYMTNVKENESHFKTTSSNTGKRLCKKLNASIQLLVSSQDNTELKKHGLKIFEQITGFSSEVKDLLDDKRDSYS